MFKYLEKVGTASYEVEGMGCFVDVELEDLTVEIIAASFGTQFFGRFSEIQLYVGDVRFCLAGKRIDDEGKILEYKSRVEQKDLWMEFRLKIVV